jgi:hypothetical protein
VGRQVNLLSRRTRRAEPGRHVKDPLASVPEAALPQPGVAHGAGAVPVPAAAPVPEPDTAVFAAQPGPGPASFPAMVASRLRETAPGSPEVLARVIDGLETLPESPAASTTTGDPERPAAWMRSWQHDGQDLPVELWGSPSVAGYRDSEGVAGIYLGKPDAEGRFAIDAGAAYLDALIEVAQEARDGLLDRGFGRAVPAAAGGGGQ